MLCRDVMKKDLKCLHPGDSVQRAALEMRNINAGVIPICEDSGEAVGVVTDRDLTIKIMAEARPLTTPVEDVMSRDIVACRPTDDLQLAQELMAQHRKSRILCIDDENHLVGLISLSDIAVRGDGLGATRTLRQVAAREVRGNSATQRSPSGYR